MNQQKNTPVQATNETYYIMFPHRERDTIELITAEKFFSEGGVPGGGMFEDGDEPYTGEAWMSTFKSWEPITLPHPDFPTLEALESYVNNENNERAELWNGSEHNPKIF